MISGRMLEVLKILKSKSKPISGKEICFNLGITTRTLRNDLKKEKEKLEKLGMKIKSVPGQGYLLDIIDEDVYYQFLSTMLIDDQASIPKEPEDRVHYIIKRLLGSSESIKAQDLCDEMYISRSTFNQDMIEVKKRLQYFNLSVESRPFYGMHISGEEIRKRSAIAMYFYGDQSKNSFYYKKNHENKYEEVSDMLLKLMHQYSYHLTEIGFKNLVTHILIMLIRLENDFVVPTPDKNHEIAQTKAFEISAELCEELENVYHVHIPLNERLYIAMHLSGKESSLHMDANQVLIDKNRDLFKEIYAHIFENYGIDLSQDIDLFTSLSLHFEPMRHRLEYGLRIENPLLDVIKQEQSKAFEVSVGVSEIIEKHWGYSLSEEEIGYIALHFALSIDNYYLKNNQKNVLIVCASGLGSSQILYHKIRKQFSKTIGRLDVNDVYSLERVNFDQYDFVLSTVSLNKKLPIPVLYVNYFLDDADVLDIKDMINDHDENDDFIEKYFRDDLFFVDVQGANAQEVIVEMCEKVHAKMKLPEGFLESVLKREQYSSTEFGNQIAIPHPMKPMMSQTFVAIGILEKPIEWKDTLVKYVFLMNVSDQSDDSLSLFHEVLSALTLDTQAMLDFEKSPSMQTMKRILRNIAKEEAQNEIDILFK